MMIRQILIALLLSIPLCVNGMDNNNDQQLFSIVTSDGRVRLNNDQLTTLQNYSETFKGYCADSAEPQLMQVAPAQDFPQIPLSTQSFTDILADVSCYAGAQKKSVAKKDIINLVKEKTFDDILHHIDAAHFLDMPVIEKLYLEAFVQHLAKPDGIRRLGENKIKKQLKQLPQPLKNELARYAPYITIQALVQNPQYADTLIKKRKIPFLLSNLDEERRFQLQLSKGKYAAMAFMAKEKPHTIVEVCDDSGNNVPFHGGFRGILNTTETVLKFDQSGERLLHANLRNENCSGINSLIGLINKDDSSFHYAFFYIEDIKSQEESGFCDTETPIKGCTISHDGTKVVSIDEKGIKIWDVTTTAFPIQKIQKITAPDALWRVKFSDQDDYLVILTGKGIKRLNYTDVEFGDYTIQCKPHPDVLKLCRKYWVYNDTEKDVSMLYDVERNTCHSLGEESYYNFAFSISGNYLVAECRDCIKVWNLKNGVELIKKTYNYTKPFPQINDQKDLILGYDQWCKKMMIVCDGYVIGTYCDKQKTNRLLIWDFKEGTVHAIPLLYKTESGCSFSLQGKRVKYEKSISSYLYDALATNGEKNADALMLPDIQSIAQPVPLDELEICIPEKHVKKIGWWW